MTTIPSDLRVGHSTEIAALRLSYMESVNGAGEVSSLVLLDLSAAFDTVDHDTLCRRLQTTFGISRSIID